MRSRRPFAPERPPALSSRARSAGRCILKAQSGADIHRAAVMVWIVVNAVNVLQALGFLSRGAAETRRGRGLTPADAL